VSDSLSPFLKWAGSKRHRYIIDKVKPIWERNQNRVWVEPFLGSGALPLALGIKTAIVSDINADLINTWKWVQSNGKVANFPSNTEEDYLITRDALNNPKTPIVDRAVFFYYLNQTCFNGLCRYSKKSGFNVPFGRDKNRKPKKINYVTDFTDWRLAISDWIIQCKDFGEAIVQVASNSVIYSDPPYSGVFTNYYGDFNDANQLELVELLAKHEGVVIASNSPKMEPYYRRAGFATELIEAPRSMGCNGNSRGKQLELFAIKGV
jgi:DNA adenine methylase